jgi:NADH-ubiquinone oxidoreductase chain 5
MGLPFLTGFYSKDLILELIYGEYYLSYALWLGIIAASITAFYSFRLIYFTFINKFQGSINSFKISHEGVWRLTTPLFILLILSILAGYFLQFFILKDELPIMITNLYKFLPLIVSLIGSILSIILGIKLINWWKISLNRHIIMFYSFSNGAWYFDNVINEYLTKPLISFGFNITYKLIDNQILESFGPTKTFENVKINSNNLSSFHLGKISVYILLFITFLFCFFI